MSIAFITGGEVEINGIRLYRRRYRYGLFKDLR